MEIILIGNYPPDKQESMQRFALMLQSGFVKEGYPTTIWKPTVIFGSIFQSTQSGIGKWIGYLDKWFIFQLVLISRLLLKKIRNEEALFHICDHSNAPYLRFLPMEKTSITCHDVLAIRGSMGHADAYCTATPTGKLYQKWILSHLVQVRKLAAVSRFTLNQLIDLQKNTDLNKGNKHYQVIHNAFNGDFKPMTVKQAFPLIQNLGIATPYLYMLHVGSNHRRKNRKLILDVANELGTEWNGQICFAGEAPDSDLLEYAVSLGLMDRLVIVSNPDHMTLRALYSLCEAFIFPSFSEGFGWPLIEAQACGAPVIASSIQPMPEISEGSALHADPSHPKDFANAFRMLQKQNLKLEMCKKGMMNIKRFSNKKMTQKYLSLFGLTK
ncbi:MAG: glycosyltransferase family 1 protein [Cyclobacterium sp.]|uniref:glycosyltransferase family 4 protein n=1 Tax=unclassified Cyclobacterium TaxID=2615055 RepID=UPI0013D39B90|nr:glycosyltransferase family 1 protein [Cyclobacterium sp. SYSU L10401]